MTVTIAHIEAANDTSTLRETAKKDEDLFGMDNPKLHAEEFLLADFEGTVKDLIKAKREELEELDKMAVLQGKEAEHEKAKTNKQEQIEKLKAYQRAIDKINVNKNEINKKRHSFQVPPDANLHKAKSSDDLKTIAMQERNLFADQSIFNPTNFTKEEFEHYIEVCEKAITERLETIRKAKATTETAKADQENQIKVIEQQLERLKVYRGATTKVNWEPKSADAGSAGSSPEAGSKEDNKPQVALLKIIQPKVGAKPGTKDRSWADFFGSFLFFFLLKLKNEPPKAKGRSWGTYLGSWVPSFNSLKRWGKWLAGLLALAGLVYGIREVMTVGDSLGDTLKDHLEIAPGDINNGWPNPLAPKNEIVTIITPEEQVAGLGGRSLITYGYEGMRKVYESRTSGMDFNISDGFLRLIRGMNKVNAEAAAENQAGDVPVDVDEALRLHAWRLKQVTKVRPY